MGTWKINKGGTDYTAKGYKIRLGGTEYVAKSVWIKVQGTWRQITFLEPTGNSYSTSIFGINNDITFQSDGDTWIQRASGGGWLSSIAAGNGSNFWIKFIRGAGGAYLSGSRSFDQRYQMSTNISIVLDVGEFGEFAYSYGTYEVSDSGATILATGSWEIYLNE